MATQRLFATVALGLFLAAPGPAQAQYNFTTYDVPGSTRTAVNGSSPHAIAGEFDDADGNTHGFVLSNGVLTQVDVPGAVFTSVNGINLHFARTDSSHPASLTTPASSSRIFSDHGSGTSSLRYSSASISRCIARRLSA
jgi:hypothetical protein